MAEIIENEIRFTSKARVLLSLEGRLKRAAVLPTVVFTRDEYTRDPQAVLQRIRQTLTEDTLAVRTRGGEDLGTMSVDDFVQRLQAEIASRGLTIMEE